MTKPTACCLRPATLGKFVGALLLLGAIPLAATGFYAWLVQGETIGGLALMVHMMASGLFLFALAVGALAFGRAHFFGPEGAALGTAAKALFWALLAAGFVSAATMLLSMLPLLGSEGLETMILIHRLSGAVFALALAGYFVSLPAALRRNRSSH